MLGKRFPPTSATTVALVHAGASSYEPGHPVSGLTGPAAVGHIVRHALARAGIRRSGRGAAHLFRHGLATKMIRHGASIAEIAEVLRHRSQNTTAIYTQVSVEALRTVAQPWPGMGGVR
jgi:site-specific recombinase XerD